MSAGKPSANQGRQAEQGHKEADDESGSLGRRSGEESDGGGGGGGGVGAVDDLIRSLQAELKEQRTQLRKQDAELALFRAEASKEVSPLLQSQAPADQAAHITGTDADSDREEAQLTPPQHQAPNARQLLFRPRASRQGVPPLRR